MELENSYLNKALGAIKKQLIVISPEYKLVVTNEKAHMTNTAGATHNNALCCHELIFNSPTPCIHCPATEVMRTGKPALRHISLHNSANTCSCLYAFPVQHTDSLEKAIVILDFDLPPLAKFDEKRLTSNVFLRNLIDNAVDGVIAADMTGKIFIFNKAATKITSYSKKDAIETLNIRQIYPPGDARKIMKKMRNHGNGGKGIVRSLEQVAIRKDNTPTPIRLNASIVYEDGKEVASIGFFHDLTENKRMEAELEKTQIQLLQAEKMSSLGKLAAGVAHQLNNPLGGITLFTQLMLEEHELSPDATNDLLRIQRDAQRCSDIVKELLEFARQTRREVRPQSINKIIARTLFLLRNQTIFQNIVIIEEYDKSIPDIPADIQQLNHVFMNIILNAADAMEGKGYLEVKTFMTPDEDMAQITITDTGPGIPKGVLSSIFEPFFTTKEEGKGTGLGLSMAYGIVESHHGKIMAENIADSGARFHIKLPLAAPAP
ncbi:two-component system sensor histidine kinase NtrB [Desulfocicer vacuolatum]|uniref:two-component system sensor histidine kinase NtrB n=1 Tax=Desulfocicer vacuolatum TaxID=2298 RepID=UPI001E4761CC|nr:ATP-binding protein [Desulfocicer vacuolatum]